MLAPVSRSDEGFVPLFNGRDLTGWFATPRSYGELWPGGPTVADVAPGLLPDDYEEHAAQHPAVWTVEDGAIVGRQDAPGSGWGGYLVSDGIFGDFELIVEANPDWPADTGIYLRKQARTFHGLQVLVDHRKSGSIGGFYGNGIGGFHAVPFALDARYDADGNAVGLGPDDPTTTLERFRDAKRDMLSVAASLEEFLDVWRWRDWNELRIRIVGAQTGDHRPGSTRARSPSSTWRHSWHRTTTLTPSPLLLGPRGHIVFEVHDNDNRFRGAAMGSTTPRAVGGTSASGSRDHRRSRAVRIVCTDTFMRDRSVCA